LVQRKDVPMRQSKTSHPYHQLQTVRAKTTGIKSGYDKWETYLLRIKVRLGKMSGSTGVVRLCGARASDSLKRTEKLEAAGAEACKEWGQILEDPYADGKAPCAEKKRAETKEQGDESLVMER